MDTTGMGINDWQDNGDGTWTVKSEGATLWDVYGKDWKEKSGYEGDPTKLQIGDTVGKKDENESTIVSDQQLPLGNNQKTNNTNQQEQQSTFSSWWNKKPGEMLSPSEINLQKGIGIGEMIAGPTLGTLGCAQTAGGSVMYGYYIMADGAVVYSQAKDGVKAIPGLFFLNLIIPLAGNINGVPVVVDYNPYPLPVSRYK